MRIPRITSKETIRLFSNSLNASGNKCMNASPKSAPAAKPTSNKMMRESLSVFIMINKTPIREIRLTMRTLNMVYKNTINSFTP